VRIRSVPNFLKGLITSVEDYSIPDGAASRLLNWKYTGDKIELRKGYKVLGTEIAGTGVITGLHVMVKANGTQVLIRMRGRKLEYYDTSTSDWVETSTANMFPAAAVDDEASFDNYASLAGNQTFIVTPNSGPFKIMSANPGSFTDLTDAAKNFQGYMKIKQNRMFLWGRKKDKTGIYGSYIDVANSTTVTAENVGSGNGVQTTFTGTLAFKSGGAVRTCFAVSIYESGGAAEVFTDNYDGTLTGSAGGTGTINYTTGAFSVTFAAAPANAANNIKADYQWENSNNNGITDFTKSSPRTAGQGFVFRQDDGGGDAKRVLSYGDVEYCMHRLKTWALTLTATDTNATNLIFRDKVGIPNWRAAVETGDGVYYVDDYDQSDPKFRLLTLNNVSTQVIPIPVSDQLNLVDYRFDKAASIEYGDYVLFACRHKDSTSNNTVFAYNKRLKLWEKYDYYVACFAIYNGALVAGDSISYNVYELFSGFDDNNTTIPNYWEGNLTRLEIEELKRLKRLWVQGEISRDQTLKIYMSFDRGPFVLVGTQNGTDDNVDSNGRTVIGSDAIGQSTLGGQTSTTVYNYIKEIKLTQGKFYEVKVKFEFTAIGYGSVSKYTYHDILLKGHKLPLRYRDN
jgi:hypothetical protein